MASVWFFRAYGPVIVEFVGAVLVAVGARRLAPKKAPRTGLSETNMIVVHDRSRADNRTSAQRPLVQVLTYRTCGLFAALLLVGGQTVQMLVFLCADDSPWKVDSGPLVHRDTVPWAIPGVVSRGMFLR